MNVVALAGGVGAGKFLRGVVRVVPPEDVTVIVNTGDDLVVHGLHVSPDLDSVLYWLAGAMDRERGWGRDGETFRATGELRRLEAEGAWFGLGDLDLATHLLRTSMLAEGEPLSEVTGELARRFGVTTRLLPMSDDRVTTRVVAVREEDGQSLDLHFQEYWVQREGQDEVKRVRFEGVERALPAPGVLDALSEADVVLLSPSNPIASIAPILSVSGVREAVRARRDVVAGVSPIVSGAPLRGMADKLLPSAGVEVTSAGVAEHYAGLLGGWVMDVRDASLMGRVEALGVRVALLDTIMADDLVAAAVARAAVDLALAGRQRP